MPYHRGIYADFDDSSEDCFIYIGGPYYADSAQIHLTVPQARHLAKWMTKISAYLEQPQKKRKKKDGA